ncbi:DeoR family transcriptional regulator [Paeniglutamicibacter kerguelensis]|uniref:DeoR family transcriptional regulator n=1 Tax=Paeniglutamicibacter kerguelensis TaxID=254788 RepID=UPI003607865F
MSEERQNRILRELALRGSLNAADFARSLGISGMTVRRDLALLEEQGALQRVHGGRLPLRNVSGIPEAAPSGMLAGTATTRGRFPRA